MLTTSLTTAQNYFLPFKVIKFFELVSTFGITAGNSLARTCGSIFNVATPVSSSLISAKVEYCLGEALDISWLSCKIGDAVNPWSVSSSCSYCALVKETFKAVITIPLT